MLTRRRVIRAAVAVAVIAAIGVVVVIGRPLTAVATAYTAQTVCSETFVGGRDAVQVVSDLAIDDLRPLRLIRVTVDTIERVTIARFPLLPGRTARYCEVFGCVLQPPGSAAIATPAAPSAALATQANYADRDSAATLSPNNRQAMDEVLDDAFGEPDSAHPRRTRAIVVMQHGVVVAERYAAGAGAETPLSGWSMTKSVLNALVGIAVRDGVLSLNDPVRLRMWSAPGDPRARISINDLLRMSSGLRFDEGEANPSSDVLRMLYDEPDMASFAADKVLESNPGSRWKYSSGTSVILSRVLREALGDQAYWRFPRAALFAPLGMRHALLQADPSGTFVASSYMYATAREWGRFGQLYLQDGVWRGERILPEGWVEYTRTPAPAAPSTYGAHFWLSTPIEYRGPTADLPAGVFHAVGHEGQFVTLVPSRNVVIVRLGRTRYPNAWAHDRFVSKVLAALPE